jgi:hypothetical protein
MSTKNQVAGEPGKAPVPQQGKEVVEFQEKNLVTNQASGPIQETGLEAMDQGDLIIPRLSITQPTSPDVEPENKGKLFNNLTSDYFDTMNCVLIRLTKSRILFPVPYDVDNEPLCRSHDFLSPANDIPDATPMCDTCQLTPDTDPRKGIHDCDYANWSAGPKGKNMPPRCNEVWDMLICDLDSYMPMLFSVKSTSLTNAKKICSAINMIAKAKNIPMWHMRFLLAVEKNKNGEWFNPSFSSPKMIDDQEEKANMNLIRSSMVNLNLNDYSEPLKDDAAENSAGSSQDDEKF